MTYFTGPQRIDITGSPNKTYLMTENFITVGYHIQAQYIIILNAAYQYFCNLQCKCCQVDKNLSLVAHKIVKMATFGAASNEIFQHDIYICD